MEKLLDSIIEENKELFESQELEEIRSNKSLCRKLYLMGLIHGKQIYEIPPNS